MRVIGYHTSNFTFDDGRTSSGVTLYLAQDISPDMGKGIATERAYLSNTKLNGYFPSLGDEVIIDRNASGAIRGIYVINKVK